MFKTKSNREISYYGREYSDAIPRLKKNSKINSLDELFTILLETWCKESAYPSCQKDYIYDNDPTYGQCAITATLVYDMFGGTIHKIRVDGGETHYFNKINGHYIDLTRDQFDLYNISIEYEPNEIVLREYCRKNANTMKRYNLLIDRIHHQLTNNKSQS